MANRRQERRGTTAQWTASTVPLLDGEIGIEKISDGTECFKFGDGINLWASLKYQNGVKNVTGTGGALVTTDSYGNMNVNVSGTGGDMLQANYSNGNPNNPNPVDVALTAKAAQTGSALALQLTNIVDRPIVKKGVNILISPISTESNLKSLIDQVILDGVNTIAIIVTNGQYLYTDNTVRPIGANELLLIPIIINYCNSKNLEVIFRCGQYTDDGHGSQIQPSNPTLWLTNLKVIMLQYCSIIYPLGVRNIGITNENISMTNGNIPGWTDIINSIHASYPSIKVFFTLNIYEYTSCVVYGLFDIIGFNFYPCLTTLGKLETDINLRKAFFNDLNGDNLIDVLVDIKNTYNKEIWITEVGCWSDANALYQTWKNTFSSPVYDEETQKIYYDLFFELLYKRNSTINAMCIWTVSDAGYTFIGKQAEQTVIDYWRV